MKSFVAGLVLALSLGLALAAPPQSTAANREIQAIQECNATNPVQRNPRIVIAVAIAAGEKIVLSQEEKCFLFCSLQKVNFLNENADVKNGPGLVNYTVQTVPEIGKYAHHLIATLWQTKRWTKGIEDKCQKAYTVFIQYSEILFTTAIADAIDSSTHIKEKINAATENGQSVDPELSKQVKRFLEFYDTLLTAFGKQIEKQTQSQ